MNQSTRPINAIAFDILSDWKKVNFAAKPYLTAMFTLRDANDYYGCDSAKSIVLYFLSNASSYRGEKAKQLKAELKAIIK